MPLREWPGNGIKLSSSQRDLGWREALPQPVPILLTMTQPSNNPTVMASIAGGEYFRMSKAIGLRHSEIARHNGWEYRMFTHKLNPSRNWSWNKLDVIIDLFDEGYQRVVWCDADCLPVKMRSVEFTGEPGLWVSRDFNGPCCGFMSIDSSMLDVIESWRTIGPLKDWTKYDNRDTWEQNTLKLLLDQFDHIAKRTYLIPESCVANPSTKDLHEPPTFLHVWGNGGVDAVEKWMDMYHAGQMDFLREKGILRRTEPAPPDSLPDHSPEADQGPKGVVSDANVGDS